MICNFWHINMLPLFVILSIEKIGEALLCLLFKITLIVQSKKYCVILFKLRVA
jgi:hypothetical protein